MLIGPIVLASVMKWSFKDSFSSKPFHEIYISQLDEQLKRKNVPMLSDQQRNCLLEASPPDNIMRVLESCGDNGIRSIELKLV